ncbi:MAG: tRNA/rRNA methyltransferase [Pseudomonadota bacterium]
MTGAGVGERRQGGGRRNPGTQGGRPPRDPQPRHGRDPETPARRPSRPPPPAVQADAPARPGRAPRAREHAEDAPADAAREVRLYGINACRAFVARRRDRVIRGYFTEAVGRRHFATLMKWLAQQRLAYHLVTEAELERISGSAHHEGVCLLVRSEPARAAEDWLREHRRVRRSCLLALENVGNPHNLGAILRSAAHFGVGAVLVPDARVLAGGAALRTAEGGAEHVEVLDAASFARTVQDFRAAGWRVVTTSSHAGSDLYRVTLPEKCLLLFGEESSGLSTALLGSGDLAVRIPGTGNVESLNVSVAVGVLLGEWWRRHPPG